MFFSLLQVCRDDGKIVVAKKRWIGLYDIFTNDRYQGENFFKLFHRIRETYVGISKEVIQSWIYSNEEHSIRNPIFSNRGDLKPIIATKPMERIQICILHSSKI